MKFATKPYDITHHVACSMVGTFFETRCRISNLIRYKHRY